MRSLTGCSRPDVDGEPGGIASRRASTDRASEADQSWCESALRPKLCLLAIDQKLRAIVASKLILDWSPEQISAWLKVHYPSNESMRVSHETPTQLIPLEAREC